jgi:hypothetical protein
MGDFKGYSCEYVISDLSKIIEKYTPPYFYDRDHFRSKLSLSAKDKSKEESDNHPEYFNFGFTLSPIFPDGLSPKTNLTLLTVDIAYLLEPNVPYPVLKGQYSRSNGDAIINTLCFSEICEEKERSQKIGERFFKLSPPLHSIDTIESDFLYIFDGMLTNDNLDNIWLIHVRV